MKERSVWTPLYSIFINVDSGHLTLEAATAQHPLTLTSVLPVLPHQSASPSLPHRLSALSTHNGIFSSEKMIPGDKSHIPTCCDY